METDRLPTPYQAPYATPEGEGAGFGRVLEQGASVLAGYAKDAKERADTTAVQGTLGQAQGFINTKILDPDPNGQGYARLRGEDAIAARDKVLGDFNKSIDSLNDGLTPDQQRMIAPHLRSLKEQGYAHVIGHETVEQERYSQAQYKGNVDTTIQAMQMPQIVTEPEALKAKIQDLYQAGIDEARRKYGANAGKDAIAAVVTPELQNASLAAMQSAVAQAEQAGDPSIAKNAFDVLGKYMITNHQQQFAKLVGALSQKDEVTKQSRAVVASSVDSVPVPGADPVARVDDTKFAKILASIPPDSKYAAEIEATAQKQKATLDKVWNGAVGSVYQRVESAALQGGGFDLDRASTADKEWLRINAPAELLKLQHEDTKGTGAADKAASQEAWSSLAADMAAHPDLYKDMGVPQFTKLSVDQGVGALDRVKALKLFNDVQKTGLSEKINSTVRDQLLAAMPQTSDRARREALQGPLLDAASKFVDDYKATSEGKLPTTDKIREFVNSELVQGKVKDTGRFFDDTRRRIEYETTPAYQGKQFVPLNAPATPATAVPVRAATPAATPKTITGYRFNKSNTKRIPVFSDGTEGPAEAVK
jgi:hypothetical protein